MKHLFKNPYREIEKKLGYRFRRKRFLKTALMHRSFKFESDDIEADNQRLEFLGDSILSLVTTEYLFHRFPDMDEGGLTALRSRLTAGKALVEVGRAIELGTHIQLGKGELMSGGAERESNIEDAMEAILGAAFLDGGQKAVGRIFKKLFLSILDISPDNNWLDNPKGELQQIVQTRWNFNPVYKLAEQTGPAHARIFTIEIHIKGTVVASAQGSNKRKAEYQAAVLAIQKIREEDNAEV